MSSVDLHSKVDRAALEDFRFFLEKINERNLFVRGLVSRYEAPSEALGEDVEYFSTQITLDDRMVYIMRHIVTHPGLSEYDKIGNTIISHFYGARGIHSVLTREDDPDKAHVKFEVLAEEQRTKRLDYTLKLREDSSLSRKEKLPFWGTTELHTSIMGAGNGFAKTFWDLESPPQSAVAEWIASWINTGIMDSLLSSKNLESAYKVLTSQKGVGAYYGYHCATSNSVNPSLAFNHDDTFCSPGPGARFTLDRMFPGLSGKEASYGSRVVWIRENQEELFPGLSEMFHPETHNVVTNGVKIFEHEQNELKVYGTEVGLCQYGVYCRLKENPALAKKRKVSRAKPTQPALAPELCSIESFFSG